MRGSTDSRRWTLSVLVTDENTTQASSIKPIWMNSPDPPLFASSQQPPPTVAFLSPKKKIKTISDKDFIFIFFYDKVLAFLPVSTATEQSQRLLSLPGGLFRPTADWPKPTAAVWIQILRSKRSSAYRRVKSWRGIMEMSARESTYRIGSDHDVVRSAAKAR